MPLDAQSYIDAWKDNAWVRDFVSEWQTDRKTGGGDSALVFKLHQTSKTTPDGALCLFVAVAQHCAEEHDEALAIAEEFEWFLQYHGAPYWDVVNSLCGSVPRFRSVVSNVWGAGLPKDLKRKVEMWKS